LVKERVSLVPCAKNGKLFCDTANQKAPFSLDSFSWNVEQALGLVGLTLAISQSRSTFTHLVAKQLLASYKQFDWLGHILSNYNQPITAHHSKPWRLSTNVLLGTVNLIG